MDFTDFSFVYWSFPGNYRKYNRKGSTVYWYAVFKCIENVMQGKRYNWFEYGGHISTEALWCSRYKIDAWCYSLNVHIHSILGIKQLYGKDYNYCYCSKQKLAAVNRQLSQCKTWLNCWITSCAWLKFSGLSKNWERKTPFGHTLHNTDYCLVRLQHAIHSLFSLKLWFPKKIPFTLYWSIVSLSIFLSHAEMAIQFLFR